MVSLSLLTKPSLIRLNSWLLPFSSLRFGQFCDFHPKVCFSASGSKRFEILPFSSSSLIPSIFLR
ncbi:hypothetical protein Hanom_Chr14g01286271 [Helianthus anomalus]